MLMQKCLDAMSRADLYQRMGYVREIAGLAVEADGPDAAIGELCLIVPRKRNGTGEDRKVFAEVVALRHGRVTLMPYGSLEGIAAGCEVLATGSPSDIGVGDGLIGRVITGFGEPLDGLPAPVLNERKPLKASPINPLERPRIEQMLETGIRGIDTLLTLGRGQRTGIFAGSGVGKSTLLGMIARHVRADLNVIALIGERGREVREYIEIQLGNEGLQRSVVVVATSDQPALARMRAAYAALAIAEFFRDRGRQVLLTMDSITRFAMARREVGLSAGEPPTARGYTPSVFSELPELCERCGTAPGGGSITALLTVLVEGNDFNEPISDCLRATLDGHIVLSRSIAHQGNFPAIDYLQSASRLMNELVDGGQRMLAIKTMQCLALLEKNRQMVDIGAYQKGANKQLDQALQLESRLMAFLRQEGGGASYRSALLELTQLMGAY